MKEYYKLNSTNSSIIYNNPSWKPSKITLKNPKYIQKYIHLSSSSLKLYSKKSCPRTKGEKRCSKTRSYENPNS